MQVPSGTNTGDKQRIKSRGIKNSTTGKTGDMYIIFKVIIPSKLTKEQKNLLEKLNETNLNTNEIDKFNRFVEK